MQLVRPRSFSLLLASMLAIGVLGGPVASAQGNPVSDAFCAALTVEEVAAALGEAVTATPDETGCTWAATDETKFAYLGAHWDTSTLEQTMAIWSSGTSLTVAGHPAYYASDVGIMWVQLDQGVLSVQLGTLAEIDQQATLEGLAGLIASRAGTLVAPPPAPTQAPVPHADPGLEALFPTTIGGQPLTVSSMAGSDIFSSDNEGTAAFLAALTAHGKTMDDVSIASGYNADFSSGLFAIRIAGGDASVFAPLLLATVDPGSTQAPAQVAGKDVTVVTSESTTQYVYAKNDIVWAVTATEPALSEIVAALP